MNRILLVDLSERDLKERMRLEGRLQQLENIRAYGERNGGGLSAPEKQEHDDIVAKLASDVVVDRFYQVVAETYTQRSWQELLGKEDPASATAAGGGGSTDDTEPGAEGATVATKASQEGDYIMKHGFMGSQRMRQVQRGLGRHEQEIAGICGLLEVDNLVYADRAHFRRQVAQAQGEYREGRALFDAVFQRLSQKYIVTLKTQIDKQLVSAAAVGCIVPDNAIATRKDAATERMVPALADPVAAVSARNAAAVVRRLTEDGVSANDPWLLSRIDNAYDMLTGMIDGGPASAIEINLPDLEEAVDVEIVRENLHAMQAHYFAYQLEEMRLFQVIDQIVLLFRQGMLPLGRGKAGDRLYKYFKSAGERITETERRDLYMRAFGAPGGDPNAILPNREFSELWLRFVSSVSSYARQLTLDRVLRTQVPVSISQEQVRKAGRDLAANLSLHGFGIAYFVATDLQASIIEFRDLLSDPEILRAFGARDMWQVVDQVNVQYLGGQKNTHRYRTQARAGAIAIRWLANNHQRLVGGYGVDIIAAEALSDRSLRGLGSDQPTVRPTDWDLVQACEQWLAVGGVQDTSVQQYSQPIESPVMATKPIEMPQAARDILDSVGTSLPGG